MTPRIQRAIDIFLDAINNGTLAKGTCAACAVGNLVAAGMGIAARIPTVEENDTVKMPQEHWMYNLIKFREGGVSSYYMFQEPDKADVCMKALEFSVEEIDRIETAFERGARIPFSDYYAYEKNNIRQDQIRGLEAVVQVMLQFDNCKESVAEVFTQRAEVIPA